LFLFLFFCVLVDFLLFACKVEEEDEEDEEDDAKEDEEEEEEEEEERTVAAEVAAERGARTTCVGSTRPVRSTTISTALSEITIASGEGTRLTTPF
jgi:Na+-transporting methylmalonyl-CoA/oxaloacetate decarboxylase gamma subunit